jgi:hypothetical protein
MKVLISERQKMLIVEQKWKKRLFSALTDGKYDSDVLTKSVVKTLKTIDVNISNKFLNYKVSNIGDMVKYLDEFESIWKASLGEQGFKNFKETMDMINNKDYVKKILSIYNESQKKYRVLYSMMKNNIPKETHEIFDEMLLAAMANKNLSSSVIVTNPKVTLVKDVKTNTNVVKTDVGNKYNKINDDGSIGDVTDVVLDNLEGKEGIDTEYMFFSDDVKSFFDGSGNFPKTDTPKDVEVVVGNLKSKNIDYKTLDKHIEELGIKDWGDKWREFNVDGKPVKFRFGGKGALYFSDEFLYGENNKVFYDLLHDKWKKSNTSKSLPEFSADLYKHGDFGKWTTLKYDDIFGRTDVPGGVRQRFKSHDGSFISYITVNPKAYDVHKSKSDFYDNLIWVIEHEIGHVEQPAMTINHINQFKYNPNIRNGNTNEVISHLNKKIDGNEVLRYDIDLNELGEKVTNILINDFNKEFPHLKNVDKIKSGKIINSDFFEYCANRLTDANMGSQIKEIRNKITVFKNWEKANAYRYFFKNYQWDKGTSMRQTIDEVMSLSDADLIKYIENNAYADKNIKKILYDSAYNLSYLSNRVEIEADFSGLIGHILRKGADKSNKGFTTWMVDYLKSTNKKVLLKGESGPLKIFKKLKGEYPNPIKQKGKGWDEFKEFLLRLEGPYKSIYPKEGGKMYKDLYKQLHELISKGYPALLPFVFPNGLENFDLNEPKTINESIKNFNKLIITESQYKLLKEFKKKAYSFDWDDNILVMPTRIHLDYNVNSNDISDLGSEGNTIWVPVSVSTEQFRSVRHKLGKEFRYPNDNILSAFKDFRDYDAFIEDTKRALTNRSYGPSFVKFKEALISGSDFSIITARSNPPKAIKEGIKLIIRDLSWGEGKEMEKNLNGLSIDEYLNLQDYHPVSSEEFAEKFDLDSVGTNPEEGKKIAFKSFVDRIVSQISKIKDDKDFEGISVGFSDDDLGNVEVVEDLIRDELKTLYPEIEFTIYDTSDPKDTKKKRIIIKK